MDKLQNARKVIDEVDGKMAELFARRMQAVRDVVEYKMENNLPILDASREEAVVAKNMALLNDKGLEQYFEDFIRHNMAISRAYQGEISSQHTAAYQGVEGAFSHIALRRLFPHATPVAYASWKEVFSAVASGKVSRGVLPFENSQAGDVSEVLDLCFANKDIYVTAVYDLPVEQNLIGVKGSEVSDIKKIISHPQALSQSAKFIEFTGAETETYPNTAAAAQKVAELGNPTIAAVASKETAELYGLEILREAVQESQNNTTRFIVIEKNKPTLGNHFSLLFTVRHAAGQLARVMQVMGENGYNMVSIKSRPMPNVPWEYYFYTEVEGVPSKKLFDDLNTICHTHRVLGVYNR